MPPRKTGEDGEVDFYAVHAPLSTPLSFVGPRVLCYVTGSSVCLLDTQTRTRNFLHTSVYGITRLAACPAKGLLAFCEGGTAPHVFVYSAEHAQTRLLFTLSDVTELELADLAFSRCGSRLYTLSRATTKRLTVFSTITGERLKGCELSLPLRFDKISVFPGNKDQLALVRSSTIRIVSIQKSFEMYICRLQASSIPSDVDISISAFAWTAGGHFLFATRQGTLCTLDGSTGAMLHACQAPQPITSIGVTTKHVLTAHIGNQLNFWSVDTSALGNESSVRLGGSIPQIDGSNDGRPPVYMLAQTANLQHACMDMRPEQRISGQIAHVQVTPDYDKLSMTTAEGEVWIMKLSDPEEEPGEVVEMLPDSINLSLLAWFHTHPITDMCLVGKQSQVCATADEGGRVRIWELTRGPDPKGFRTLRFTCAVTSMVADADAKLLVIGSDNGCIHVASIEDWRMARVLETIRISEVGIAMLRCITHTDRCMMVAAALFNHKVAIFTVAYRESKPRMMGFIELGPSAKIEDLCFHAHDFRPDGVHPSKLVVVGHQPVIGTDSSMACVWYLKCPPLDHDPTVSTLARDVCPMVSCRLELNANDRITAVASASKKNFLVGFASGGIVRISIPTTVGPPAMKHAPAEAADAYPSHGQLVTRLRVALDGSWLLTSSMDGMIRKVSYDNKDILVQKYVHNPYNGGVADVCCNEQGTLLTSTGGADGVLVWSDPQNAPVLPEVPNQSREVDEKTMDNGTFDVDDRNSTEFPVWVPITSAQKAAAAAAEAGDDPEVSAVAAAQRKALLLEVDTLRKKLRSLIEQNATCPDLEKIDRGEFCIDFEERDIIGAKTKERCDTLRAQLQRENHARQLTRDRLIDEFWKPMRTKGCLIGSLMSNLSVSNYPERIVSEEEQGTIRKLRIMRQIEQLEDDGAKSDEKLKHDVILKPDEFTTGQEEYIVNWWPKGQADKQQKKLKAAKSSVADGEEAGDGDGEKQEEEDSKTKGKEKKEETQKKQDPVDQKYLYDPFELLTNSRRRLQVHLLQSLAADYRAAFNTLFEECQKDKKGILDQIKEKNTRIKAILGELQINEEVPEPETNELEDKDAVLKVRDAEIKAEKFYSEEEKKRMAEEAAKEAERLRQLRENDAGQRALMQMMGGTLKTKKDLSALEIVLDKEAWMDEIPEEDMTDKQLADLKEFREKEKALLEEQDKYRKQLDAEHKRLLQEVQELTQQFEGVLKELHHQRFAHDAKFFCQELYCVRLQLALLQNVEDNHVLAQSTLDVQSAKEKLATADARLEAFHQEVQERKERQDDRVRHEREVASAQHFRQQFAQSGLEPELVTSLLQIFRRRPDKKGERKSVNSSFATHSQAASAGESADPFDTVSIGDPYPDLGTPAAEKAATVEAVEEDVPVDDCPEGVDEGNFRRMNELRRERMHAEAEVQRGNAVLQEMAGLLSHYQNERNDAKAEYDQLCTELSSHKALMDRELFDVELLFKLRQGQVEVPQAAVVTDYSDAVIIDTEVVEKRNRRILELGKDKVQTLETTREFRKRLNLIQWEHKMLALQTTDLEERTKDVHMLRVTKGLQSLLKGGEESRNKAEVEMLEKKVEHLNTTTQQKEQSLKKQYASSLRATKLRKMENNLLEKKLRELQQNVIQREHIRRLRAHQGGGSGPGPKEGEKPRIIGGGGRIEENEAAIRSAQTSFKEVRTRQSLMDAAKKHTEEIDLLRRELDRLRQRTFPSFVQLHEDQPSNPDYRN